MRLHLVRCALVLALVGSASSPALLLAADEAEAKPEAPVEAKSTASPSIGSWLNTPPDRQAVAFDSGFNRLYFNAKGEVVGRYNRLQKKFQAGDFRPAQWHNIAASENTASNSPSTAAENVGSTTGAAADDSAATPRYPIIPYPRDTLTPPEPEAPKPAEIFRRGQSSASGGGRSRAKVIEAFKP